jgi:hypothetical protein
LLVFFGRPPRTLGWRSGSRLPARLRGIIVERRSVKVDGEVNVDVGSWPGLLSRSGVAKSEATDPPTEHRSPAQNPYRHPHSLPHRHPPSDSNKAVNQQIRYGWNPGPYPNRIGNPPSNLGQRRLRQIEVAVHFSKHPLSAKPSDIRPRSRPVVDLGWLFVTLPYGIVT